MAREICGIISVSTDSLTEILSSDPRYPDKSTFYRWIQKKPKLRDMFAAAKKLQLSLLADEILEIANTPKPGVVIVEKNGKKERRMADMTEHRKIQIDARKWILSKLDPMKYGDMSRIQGTGADKLDELTAAMKAGPVPRGQVNADD